MNHYGLSFVCNRDKAWSEIVIFNNDHRIAPTGGQVIVVRYFN